MYGPSRADMRRLVDHYDRVTVNLHRVYVCAKLQFGTYRVDHITWAEHEPQGIARWVTFHSKWQLTPRETVRALVGAKRVR